MWQKSESSKEDKTCQNMLERKDLDEADESDNATWMDTFK